MKSLLAGLLVLGFAVGCESKVEDGGSGGDGGSGATGASGGQGGDGGGTAGNGGTGGNTDCSAYQQLNNPPQEVVSVVLQNDSAKPVYIGSLEAGCSGITGYRAETPNGEPVKTELQLCEFSCIDLALGSCGCPADCAQPIVTMIYPGGSYATSWVKQIFAPEEMPAECYNDPGCVQPSCMMGDLPNSPLVFLADGYPDLGDCNEAICDCDGGLVGSCIVSGATIVSGTPAVAQTEWDATADTITLRFE